MKIRNGNRWPDVNVTEFENTTTPSSTVGGITLYLVSNHKGLYGIVMDTDLLFVTPYYDVARSYIQMADAA